MRTLILLFSIFSVVTFGAKAQCDKLNDFIFNGSGQTKTDEAIDKAFDGNVRTKWCDDSSPLKYLEVIFENPMQICKMIVQHAQAGGEGAELNTSKFRIQSYNNGEWVDVVSIKNNKLATTTHEVRPFTTIAVRLILDKPTLNNDNRARIYEFEIYGKPGTDTASETPVKRVYPYKVTGSAQNGEGEAMVKAFDGNDSTKWCGTNSGQKWLGITFFKPVKLTKVVIHHGGLIESAAYNTRNFKFEAKTETGYNEIINVTNNSASISTHVCEPQILSDEIRFLITQAEQNGNAASRICEMNFFAAYDQIPGSPVVAGDLFTIYPHTGDKVLSIENSSLDNNAKARAYTDASVNSQRWKLIENGDKYLIQNTYTGKYLAADGSYVIQRAGPNNTARWDIIPVENENNSYHIVSYSGLYLRKPLDTEGSLVILSPKNEQDIKRGQVWKFVKAPVQENQFSATLRNEIMDTWANKFYMPATFSPAFRKGNAIGYVLERPGFWDTAENMEILLDAYETTGKDEYRTMYNEVFDNFLATQYIEYSNGWKANDFNDDLAWLVIGMVRAHLLFGDEGRNYKALAQEYFDFVYDRGLLPENHCAAGLIIWNARENPNGTNSCVNGPMEVAACYLASATGDDSYYDKARKIYDLHRLHLTELPIGKGHVYDDWDCTKTTNPKNIWASTYNQGTFLGAAVMLYKRYGDTYEGKPTTYKDDAQKVIDYTMGNYFCDNGILKVCQSDGNLVGFKGILMRYVRNYIEDMPGIDQDKYKNWMIKNVLHAYNNRNSQLLSWSAWMEKTVECNYRPHISGGKHEHQIYGAFGTGTIVSAAVNIPYVDDDVSIETPQSNTEESIVVAAVGKQVFISSKTDNPIQQVNVYDLQGRALYSKKDINAANFDMNINNTSVIIVQVQTKKISKAYKVILR